MATGRVGYQSLRALLGRVPIVPEEEGTAALIRRCRGIRRRGELTRAQFLAMCRWKSPRALPQYRRNPSAAVRRASRAALGTRSERRRMEHLTRLRGVSVPMASAILTLIDPRRYGVLDIRVWQLLFAVRSVGRNPRGRGFTVAQWLDFLAELRGHARALGVSARAVERTLFAYHRRVQHGRLYD
ncbi:MAG TPA: hypothetical protein VFN71_00590 [Methylomirabilota bacterium]|nr:hypothetical protein [Methylomirabilota bacterium]